MARTLSGAERTVLAGQRVGHFLRVQVANAAGTLVNLSTVNSSDYQLSATIVSAIDTPADTATVIIRAGKGTGSLAPLMSAATVNSGGRMLDVGRRIVIDVAAMGIGSTPSGADWKTVFDGTIDTIAQGDGQRITLSCRNKLLALLDATAEASDVIASGTAQSMLAQIVSTYGAPDFPTIVTPVSPGWSPAKIDIARGEQVWSKMAQIADQIGWLLRYRWNGNTPELRFYAPNRSLASADWTLAASEVAAVREAALDFGPVRNRVRVGYRTTTSGALQNATATDSASVTAYGLRQLIIDEASSSQIDTLAEAQTMADAILSDLKSPPYSHTITHRHGFWAIEVGDIIDVAANGVTHDATQRLAVVGTELSLGGGGGSMTLRMRGTPASRTTSWLTLGTPSPLPAPAVVCSLIGSTATSKTYRITSTVGGAQVRYTGGSATKTAGLAAGTYGTEPQDYTFSRPAFQTGDADAAFECLINGTTDADSVTIPEVGRDTAAILTRARIIAEGTTTATVRVSASTPNSDNSVGFASAVTLTQKQSAQVDDITSSLTNISEGTANGIQIAKDDGYYGGIGGTYGRSFRDFLVTKPAIGALPARITFRVDDQSSNNLVPDADSVDVDPQVALTPGRIVVLAIIPSGTADVVIRWRAYRADGAQETNTSNVAIRTYETVAGGSSEGAAVDPGNTWDGTNLWFTSTVTRTAGSSYRLWLVLDPSGAGGTQRTEVYTTLPTYIVGAGAGAPRIATCTVFVPATAGDVELRFTTGDAPGGSTVNAYCTYNANLTSPLVGISRTHINITTGEPIAFGRATSSSPYLTNYRVVGTIELVDSSGNVLASRAIPSTSYWGA